MNESAPDPLPARGRPRDPAIDDAILDATLVLLARSGVRGTSMEKVAAEAGVSKVTIYSRYSSKADLIGSALAHLRIGDLPSTTGDTEDDLVAMLEAMRRQFAETGGLHIVGTCLTSEGAGLLETIRESSLLPRRATFVGVLKRAVERGEFAADTDLELATSMIIGSYYADYLAGRAMGPAWDREVVRAVLAALPAAV